VVADRHITPLVVIIGQTGAGKSALAMELAKRFDGEIITADSRTVYKGMDIGTAKPSLEDQRTIKHYCLDVVEPGEKFSVYDFKQLALQSIDKIARKGKLPFLVGGTGLYVDAVLYNFSFRSPPDAATHVSLERLSVEQLQDKIAAAGLPLPQNVANPRHLRRMLESGPAPAQPKKLRANTLVLGLCTTRNELESRINMRIEQMVAAGLVDEVGTLISKYGDVEALRAPGYKAFADYLNQECTLAEAKRSFAHNDMQLAKRQLTWFKRNKSVHWLSAQDKAAESADLLTTFLNKQGSA
jgi:tRNA dimethylallyltransferase